MFTTWPSNGDLTPGLTGYYSLAALIFDLERVQRLPTNLSMFLLKCASEMSHLHESYFGFITTVPNSFYNDLNNANTHYAHKYMEAFKCTYSKEVFAALRDGRPMPEAKTKLTKSIIEDITKAYAVRFGS